MRSSGLGFAILLVAVPLLGQSQTPDANAQALDRLRAEIKGREKTPAGEVFKNVQFMKTTPAATFLLIMDVGYSRGLGVTCTHCHEENNFASDDKRPKRAAREMQVMHRAFNDQLRKMVNSETSPEKRAINCSTCHQGRPVPQS